MSIFIQINKYDKESVVKANEEGMHAFKRCPIGHFSGTPRYIYHRFLSADDESLLALLPKLSAIDIYEYELEQDTIIDSIGLSHILIQMECEDEVVMDVLKLTERVLSVIEIIKGSSVEYIGWSCSDNVGSSGPDTYSGSDAAIPFI